MSHPRRVLSLTLLSLAAASLACSSFQPGATSAPASAVAATTVTPAGATVPQASVTPVPAAATGASPTAVPAATAAPTDGVPAGTPTSVPTTAAGEPVTVDACALLTREEAAALLGEPVNEATHSGGGCQYAESEALVHVAGVWAAQGEPAKGTLGTRLFVLGFFGLQLDPADRDALAALDAAGEHRAFLERLAVLSQGTTAFSAQAPTGLGDAA
jgi:hypothetical protein